MMDAKAQKLVDAVLAADRKRVEADRKWFKACVELWEYRKSKAQQGGKAGE